MSVHCLKHELCFGRIPDRNINYSDHEGVSAEFAIMKSENGLLKKLEYLSECNLFKEFYYKYNRKNTTYYFHARLY